jgi:hypothetical protein
MWEQISKRQIIGVFCYMIERVSLGIDFAGVLIFGQVYRAKLKDRGDGTPLDVAVKVSASTCICSLAKKATTLAVSKAFC